ncbi:MAG: hypothetical protein Q8Q31_00160 [Nanoarchaeota archaeon]|nr:hypothetical protein [Nanoarchaeota archaeon]
MENSLKKIFQGKIDDIVHGEFIKFSKGSFRNRYMLEAKKQKSGWAIKTSAEFANYLVRACLEKTSGDVEITGVIVATFDVSKKADFPIERIKKFMGIQQAVINSKISPSKIIKLMDEYPRAFFALTFSTPDYQLKIKAKAPKSAKPAGAGEKGPKVDFCSLKTAEESIVKDLFFDCPEFNDISINHEIVIDEVIIPKGVSDPVQLREQSKRKGKIIRVVRISDKEMKSEAAFEA